MPPAYQLLDLWKFGREVDFAATTSSWTSRSARTG